MNVLLVEDDVLDAEMVDLVLRREAKDACQLHRVETLEAALLSLESTSYDIVLLDLNLPDASGSETVARISLARNRLPLVVISGNDDPELAIELIRAGAQDFLLKGSDGLTQLYRSMRYAIERKAAELQLKQLASFDPLTNLANRQELCFQIEKAFAHADRHGELVAILFFDLDRFKLVNDIHGHEAGDTVLRTTGERLLKSIRKGDTAARLGGDEFAVVLEGIQTAEAAWEWSQAVMERLNAPVRFQGVELPVSASVGGAVYPTHGEDVESLMRSADMAMYKVKQEGRNSVAFYDERMDQSLARQHELEAALRGAIQNRELVAYFQPKIELESGEVKGFEALTRWIRSDGDIVAPNEFLPIARLLRLMPDIGKEIRRASLETLVAWKADGRQLLPISVNVDPCELTEEGFAESLIDEVTSYGLDGRLLRIEITENALLERTDLSTANLEALQTFGIGIELDDFGAGHSSLTYLRHFPIDTIKLDRSLITSIGKDEVAGKVLRAIVNLSRELGLTIVAEGIETSNQLRMLNDMGAHVGQGYLIARPMPGDALVAWLDNQASRLNTRLSNMTGSFEILDEFAILEGMETG